MSQRFQRVGGFTTLGNGDEQGVGGDHRRAVAELAGQFDLAGHAGDLLEPVAGHHAGMRRGAAGNNMHMLDAGQQAVSLRPQTGLQHAPTGNAALQGLRQRHRLLEDLLGHEVAVGPLVDRIW